MEHFVTFETSTPNVIPPAELTPIALTAGEPAQELVTASGAELRFKRRGWYEVLLTVVWDTSSDDGHRFAHTAIPDHHPLHSEAIEASVLNRLSNGEQLLRGNTLFDDGGAAAIRLEVWQDSGGALEVLDASLRFRPLVG